MIDEGRLAFRDQMLTNIDKQLQSVVEADARGALLDYPNAYSNAEHDKRHAALLMKSEVVLNKMQAIVGSIRGPR